MATLYELIALSGLIALAIGAWKLNKRYDLKEDEKPKRISYGI